MNRMLRKIVRIICGIMFVNTCCLTAEASPAYPGKIKFRQPDGQYVDIRLYGDECFHYGRTEDGYTLLKNKAGYFVYAMKDPEGNMVESSVIATDISKRDSEMVRFLSKIPKRLSFSSVQMKKMNETVKRRNATSITNIKKSGAVSGKKGNVTGNRKVLVILVDFSDKKFTKSREDVDMLINQNGYSLDGAMGSVNDFFREASSGQLNITGDVVGPYTLSHDMAYYGKNIDGYGNDINARDMAKEAVVLADADVDFSEYDSDKDGVTDGIHILYAGYGEEAGGGSDCIWAHKWEISGEFDGVGVRDYSCSPELRGNRGTQLTHIGVICHELGHTLGCMDYYDTNYSTNGNYEGTGKWDIMGSGNWNNNGASPANFNPYVRCYDFGWQSPVRLDSPQSVTIEPLAHTVYRLDTQAANEFFLLENRQQEGFDAYLPGHGLMVYRVCTDDNGTVVGNSGNRINATHPQNMYPLNAGNGYAMPESSPESYGSINTAACPFPGTSGNSSLGDETTPSIRSLNGLYTDKWIENIRENDGTISFEFDGGNGNPSGFTHTDVTASSITLTWNLYNNREVMILCSTSPIEGNLENRKYALNEMLPDNKTRVVYIGHDTTFTHTGLAGATTYYYRIHTLMSDSPVEWSKGTKTSTETYDSSRPQYIFMDSFNSFDWEQQIYQGGYNWRHDMETESADGATGSALWHVSGGMNQPSGFELHSSMLISPQLNLSHAASPLLTFDYKMGNYQKLYVYYRLSENSEWSILETLATRTKGWLSFSMELPEVSQTVQIGLQAVHNIEFGSTLNREEAFIGVDNVGVASAFKALVFTLQPSMAGNTEADIPVKVYEGSESILEYGIEIKDGDRYLCFASGGSDTIAVSGLTPDTDYTYRAYAQTQSDTIYGEEKQLRTMNWSAGNGTAESPFLITSEADLSRLSSEVAKGQEFNNTYFLLANDIKMTRPLRSIGEFDYQEDNTVSQFNGVFDGGGNTISGLKLQSERESALFHVIGSRGVVKHLNVRYDTYSKNYGLTHFGIIANNNMGAIIDCHTQGNDIIVLSNERISYIGPIATYNYGIIVSCTNKINIRTDHGNVGGIVGTNHSTIRKCINYGDITSVKGNIGGIAGYGTEGSSMPDGHDHGYRSSIVDCVNYGDMSMTGSDIIFSVGGIAGTALAEIKSCANYANINVDGGDAHIFVGGIVGNMGDGYVYDSHIADCLNAGNITVNAAETAREDVYAGGVCGTHTNLRINNCCFTGVLTCKGDMLYDAIVPDVEGYATAIRYCYYSNNNSYSKNGEAFAVADAATVADRLNAGNGNEPWHADNGIGLRIADDDELYIGEQIYVTPNGYTLPVVYENAGDATIEIYRVTGHKGMAVFVKSINPESNREFDVCNVSGLEPGQIYRLRINSDGKHSDWRETATCLSGSGTEKDPFEIGTWNNLKAMALLINTRSTGSANYYRQTASIDLNTDSINSWQPIGSDLGLFDGTYDGDGYCITNMYVDEEQFYAGMFGYVYGCIKNVNLIGNNTVNSPHSRYAGGIAGCVKVNSDSSIENCLYHGDVVGNGYVGGLFGSTSQDVYNCAAVGSLSGKGYVGGIAGQSDSDITSCYAAITAKESPVGSIVGYESPFDKTEHTYYQKGENIFESQGEELSKDEMTSDVLIEKLNYRYDNWTNDVSPYINDGYPILVKSTMTEPTVITGDAELKEDGTVSLSGTCFPSAGKLGKCGMEWRVDKQTTVESYQESADENPSPIEITVSVKCNNSKIAYRAFAEIDGIRRYGEEKSADCDVLASVENVKSVDSKPYTIGFVDGRVCVSCYVTDCHVVVYSSSGFVCDEGYITTGWKSREMPSGIYIVKISSNGKNYYEKILLQ